MGQCRDVVRVAVRGLLAAGVAGAVGCNRNATNAPSPVAGVSHSADSAAAKSLLGNSFNAQANATPAAQLPPAAPRKEGPLSPDADVAFAETEVDSMDREGRTAESRDRLADSARARYQIALKKDPKHKGAHVGLAKLYAKVGDKERAAATLQAATAHHPTDHALWYVGATTFARLGEWQAAAEHCRQALAHDPENRTYQKTFGYSLARLGRDQEALESFAKVMPEAEARYFLGRTQADLGKTAEGKAQFEIILRANPEHEGAREMLARLAPPAAVTPGGVATVGHTEAAPTAAP